MKSPPLLPAEILRRVLRLARFDGTSILMIAGSFAIASAIGHDSIGTYLGLAVAGAGAVELHGFGLLRGGRIEGMGWLVSSQMLLLAILFGYASWMLHHPDPQVILWMRRAIMTDQMKGLLAERHLSEDQLLGFYYQACYGLLGLLTLIYQGSMAVYYTRRRLAVAVALAEVA